MFKKNLIIGSVIPVLLVLFALTGCSSPTDGAPGGIGLAQLSGPVTAEQLAESFAIHDVIQLAGGTTTVVGLVPPGKTLIIATGVGIGAGTPLTVNGRIEIRQNGIFSTTTGILAKESSGSIYTGGELVLAAQYYEYPIIAAGTAFEPSAAILSLPGANAATINEFFGKPGINNIKNDTVTLSAAHVSALENWTGAKKLILESSGTLALGSFDVSAESLGKLVIGGNVTVTIPAGGAVKAQAETANVTVAEGGKIILPAAAAPDHVDLQGKIIVDGGILSAADSATTAAIPADVDLTKGILSLEGATSTTTITLPDASRTIGGIIAAYNLTIAGPATTAVISVGTISGTAGVTLTLPGVTVEADEIELDTGTFTIAGPGGPPGTTLKPAKVSGGSADVLTFTNATNIALAGDIELSATIILDELTNLGGQPADQLAQLTRITGGMVQAADDITFSSTDAAPLVFNTAINVDAADITISTSATFNKALTHTTSGTASIGSGTSPVTVTLEENSDFGNGLTVTGGTAGVIITGNGGLNIGDTLTAGGLVTFSGGEVTLAAAGNSLAAATLVVGSNTTVTAGNLVFGAGTYTAAGTITIDATGSEISGAAVTDTLALGNNDPATSKLLTLVGGTTNGTFTAGANATVTLSGAGNGAIVVTPTGATATLTVGAAAELKLGDGIIALEYANATDIGSLDLTTGAKLSGFTYNGTALQNSTDAYQPSFTTGGQSVLGKYYTDGVDITIGSGTYAYDDVTTLVGTITGNSTSYAARAIHGGIINKNSDIAR
jgi:hypothetical protein